MTAGVRVAVFFPRWNMPCATCESFLFREDGSVQRDAAGDPQPRGTLPTPCHKCPKVPKHARDARPGDWKYLRTLADELTPQHRKAWAFYRAMRAVNWQHPAALDPLVLWYAGPIRDIEDERDRLRADRSADLLDWFVKFVATRGLSR
jgi:hypothetical protein